MREMKDSGIEWIGKIPADWIIQKVKNATSYIGSGTTPTSGKSEFYDDGTVNWIQSGDLYGKDEINDVSANVTDYAVKLFSALHIYKAPFIVIAMYGGSVGNIAISNIDACVNQACCCIQEDSQNYLKFMYYWLFSCKSDFLRVTDGGGQPNISQTKIKNQYYLQPSLPEQHSISSYLDAKCAEIDALTVDIQSQIEMLEQYKRSVITEAVTKGLDKDVEMKDSGIDGAGVTPSHWKTTRLCYECYIRARLGWRGLKADEYVDEGYAFISAFNIQNGKLVWTPLNYITKERFDESPEIKLHSGDVLIVKDGAGVGKCARVDDLPMGGTAPNSSIAVITPSKNLDYRYVCYYLQSAVFNNFVLLLYNGMGVPHLTQEVMSKIKILVPPLKEQMVISDYLDAKCTEIDAVVETKKSQLATLDEYKKSLIFEYVTGKKEVPAV